MKLFNRLQLCVCYPMARLAKCLEIVEHVGLKVRSEPPKRDAVVHVASGLPASLASIVIAGARFAFLRRPIRPPVVWDTLAFMLRVQRADAVGISANAGTKSSGAFAPGTAEFRAAPLAIERHLPRWLAGGILTRWRAMLAPAMRRSRRLGFEGVAAMGAINGNSAKHGETMGWF